MLKNTLSTVQLPDREGVILLKGGFQELAAGDPMLIVRAPGGPVGVMPAAACHIPWTLGHSFAHSRAHSPLAVSGGAGPPHHPWPPSSACMGRCHSLPGEFCSPWPCGRQGVAHSVAEVFPHVTVAPSWPEEVPGSGGAEQMLTDVLEHCQGHWQPVSFQL
ncbi:hypothetical protein mRhiFer1_010310 [Rhinolophus ferrumequinum]|uniref:Protein FAM151A n=1 Tax=Rhinolophus ferrumequinum TaxID=59479 RepID=A0A7J7X6A2_RHIFE|nr:hypothetical protein mRhiFer1_010310 [Rhinolophus ferrumequinum]